MEIDFLVLADAAQVQGGKLYLLGGGWSFVRSSKFPVDHQTGIALGILVDWNETNRTYDFGLEITKEQDDGPAKVWELGGQFEQGRPPGTPPGMQQRTMVAVNFPLKLTSAGTYVATASVGDICSKRVSFEVVPMGDAARAGGG